MKEDWDVDVEQYKNNSKALLQNKIYCFKTFCAIPLFQKKKPKRFYPLGIQRNESCCTFQNIYNT